MNNPHKSLLDDFEILEGKTIGEVLPVFANVTNELHLGQPNRECASCRKPFNAVRKPRKSIRLYPAWAPTPIAFSFRICGACSELWRQGGEPRDGVSASLVAYLTGSEATQ